MINRFPVGPSVAHSAASKVPGSLDVPASVHKWTSSPETVLRKMEDLSSEFTITVTAPPEVSFETNAGWELKLVRDWSRRALLARLQRLA